MADNPIEKPVEETSPELAEMNDDRAEISQPQPETGTLARKKKSKALIAIAAVLLILAILAGGGFWGIRLYENQSLSTAKNALQQGSWAAAEAAVDRALALQQTGLLVDPVELVRVRAVARYQQKKVDLAIADFDILKASRPEDAEPYLYHAKMLYDQGKLNEAVEMGGEALARDNNLAFPFALQAQQAYQKNALVDAKNHAGAAIQRDPQDALAYQVRGSALVWEYDLDAAQADLERANELEPNQPATLANLAYIQFLREDDQKLEAAVKAAADAAAEEAEKDTAPALWAQAMLSLEQNDEDAAMKAIDRAIELDGDRPEYYYLRSTCYYKTEQEKQVLADLDKALQLNPDFAPAVAAKAAFLFGRYKAVDMEAEAARVLALAPKANLSHLMLAQKYVREREFTKALEVVEKALKAQPGPVDALNTRADIYLEQHELEKAAADFEQAAGLSQQEVGILLGKSQVQLEKHLYEDALKTLDEAAEIDPQSMSVHTARALVYLSQESPSKARKEVEEALKRDSGNSGVLLTRSLISLSENNYLSALTDVNRLGELYPEDPGLMVMRATVLFSNKDDKAALAELAKAEKIDSKLVEIYLTRAMIYMSKGDYSKAITQAQKAAALDPKNSRALGMLGEAEINKDKTKEGIEHLKQSIALDPEQRYTHYLLGMAQWEEGDTGGALDSLNKMIKMRGKLDTTLVTVANQVVTFLETVPPVVDGKRKVEDKFSHYTITYPESWVPRPPIDELQQGMQFILRRQGEKEGSLIQVQVVQLVDLAITARVTPDIVSRATAMMLEEICLAYRPVEHGAFAGQDTQGVTDTFDCTLQDENQSIFTMRQKIYIFTSDDSYAALLYINTLEKFEKDLEAADEIAASFGWME